MSMAERTALAQVYNEMHGLIVGMGKTIAENHSPDVTNVLYSGSCRDLSESLNY